MSAAHRPERRRFIAGASALPVAALLGACGGGSGGGTLAPAATRTWRMGFYPNAPQPTVASILATLDQSSPHAELVHWHSELPWAQMLGGQSPADAAASLLQFVDLVRGKGLRFGFMADLTDGLNRASEPPQLVALGRSIAEPAIQALYRAYVVAVAQALAPDYLGLTAETNLVRLQSPPAVYAAMVATANAAAADLRQAGYAGARMISVQVEVGWGRADPGLVYQGVEQDFADFPFVEHVGLSSYPYFNWPTPEDLPDDYYVRLLGGRTLPAMVAEGGWTSASFGTVASSTDVQVRYLQRQAKLLDAVRATAVVQTLYADLDLSSLPPATATQVAPFAALGLVSPTYAAKPALATWDQLRARTLA